MKKNVIKATISSCLALGFFISINAQAAFISSSFSNVLETTEITQTGNLDLFDSTMGTLNNATITLSGQSESSSILENTAAQNQTFSFESTLDFVFDLGSIGIAVSAPAFTTTLATTGGFVTLDSGEILDLGTNSDSGSLALNITGAALSNLIGVGQFSVGCITFTSTNFTGGGGNIANVQDTDAACLGEIAYNFTAADVPTPVVGNVPEPAVFWLIASSILVYLGLRARRKA